MLSSFCSMVSENVDSVVEGAMTLRGDYPEVWSICTGVLAFLVVAGVRRCFRGASLSEEATAVKNLLSQKERWRWGTKGKGIPTGNSIVCDAVAGKGKVIANFKKNSYLLDDVSIKLTSREKKALAKVRDQVLAHIKGNDDARKAREEALKVKMQRDRLVRI